MTMIVLSIKNEKKNQKNFPIRALIYDVQNVVVVVVCRGEILE